MSDTQENPDYNQNPDYNARAVALPAAEVITGMPPNWAKSLLWSLVGVPYVDRPEMTGTHATDGRAGTIPADFAWPDPPPTTLGEALAAVDAGGVELAKVEPAKVEPAKVESPQFESPQTGPITVPVYAEASPVSAEASPAL